MGLIDSLNIAVRGMQVEQNSIRTTSHNIANVETPGYSRQRQVLGTLPPFAHPAGLMGRGVEQVSVERITDPFLQGQLVRQGSLFGAADYQAQALAVVQEVFSQSGGGGLAEQLGALYDAFSDLANAATPGTSNVLRNKPE